MKVVNKTIKIYSTPKVLWWFFIVCVINTCPPLHFGRRVGLLTESAKWRVGTIDAFK